MRLRLPTLPLTPSSIVSTLAVLVGNLTGREALAQSPAERNQGSAAVDGKSAGRDIESNLLTGHSPETAPTAPTTDAGDDTQASDTQASARPIDSLLVGSSSARDIDDRFFFEDLQPFSGTPSTAPSATAAAIGHTAPDSHPGIIQAPDIDVLTAVTVVNPGEAGLLSFPAEPTPGPAPVSSPAIATVIEIPTADATVDDASVDEEPTVSVAGDPLSGITTTGSDLEIFTIGQVLDSNIIVPDTNTSGPLININDFRLDPQFSHIDGSGFAVVILDTGIDLNHPFFGPDADSDGVADRIVHHQDFANGDMDASDVNGHGSNVSSIAASSDGTFTGMAPGADIIHLKVFTDGGSGNFGFVEAALQWVITNTAAFNIVSVNMSLSDGGNYDTPQARYGVADEMAALAAQDVVVVSSSGNSFFGFNSVQGVAYPSADPNSLSVGAVFDTNIGGVNYSSGASANSTGADRITPFSQRDHDLTDIFAPGAPITGASATGGLVTMHGTSQSAPHITGITALAQQIAAETLGRRLTLTEYSDLLAQSADVIIDGDDENDNVINTGLAFPRVDVVALGNAILALGPGVPTVTMGDVSVVETDAGTTNAVFTVLLSESSSDAITVQYATSNGGAEAGSDYTAVADTLTIDAGQSSGTITVQIDGDTEVENDETFTLTLSNAVGATLGGATLDATGTILNDDTALSIAPSDAVKLEGDSGTTAYTFTVTRSGDTSGTTTVDYTVAGSGASEANADDFGGTLPTGTVTFDPTETSKDVTVDVTGDLDIESDEGFTVTLLNPSGNAQLLNAQSTGTILNDDTALSIAPSDAVKLEGDSGTTAHTFTVTRTGDTSGTTTVDYAVSGSGASEANADDFGGTLPSGTVTFDPTETSKQVTVDVTGDTDVESDEGFTVTLLNPSGNAQLLNALSTGSILNDDTPTPPSGALLEDDFADNDFNGWRVFDQSPVSGGPSSWSVVSEEVRQTSNIYGGVSGANSTEGRLGTMLLYDDPASATWSDYRFNVTFVSTDNDGIGVVFFYQDENNYYKVDLDQQRSFSKLFVVEQGVETTLATVPGRGFTVGASTSLEVTAAGGEITVKRDGVDLFGTVTDTTLTSGSVGLYSWGNNGARFDDVSVNTVGSALPRLTIEPSDAVKLEGDSGTTAYTFTVTRSGDTSGTTTVDYMVSGSGASPVDAGDFGGTLPSGTVTFDPTETSKQVTVDVTGDLDIESDEGFTVTLLNPSGNAQLLNAQSSGTILNDDTALSIAPSDAVKLEGDSGTTAYTFTVTRSGDTGGTTTVDYMVAGSGASEANADDFGGTLPSGTVTFDPTETSKQVTVDVTGDTDVESDEGFTVTLLNPSGNAQLLNALSTGTILNDDTPTPPAGALLEDDFADNDFNGWRVFDQSPVSGGPSSWSVVSQEVQQTSNIFGSVSGSDYTEGRLGTMLLYDDPASATWSDYRFNVNFVSTDNDGIGVVFFYQDENNYYKVDLDQQRSFSKLFVVEQGVETTLATVPGRGFTVGASTSLEVTAAGGEITVKRDGVDLFGTVTDTTLTSGSVGLYSWGNTGARFDDVSVNTVGSALPRLTIEPSDAVKLEGDSGTTAYTFTVTRSGDTSGTTTVDYMVSGSGASPVDAGDFGGTLPSGTVTFDPTETSKQVTVDVTGDLDIESDEGFTVTLLNPSGNAQLLNAQSSGTILNDDTALSIAPSDAVKLEGDSGTTAYTFTVTRTGDTSGTTTVDYAVSGSGASEANADDFGGTLPSGTVTFDPTETSKQVTVDVTGDTDVESDEGFTVTLLNPSGNAQLLNALSTGTILNDDTPTPPAGALLEDDFADNDFNGWRVFDQSPVSGGPSSWSVVSQEVQQTSNIFGSVSGSDYTEGRLGTMLLYDDPASATWSDYRFNVNFVSTDNDGIGVVFFYQDENNYYKVDLDQQRSFSKLFVVEQGVETTLATVPGRGFTVGASTSLEVTAAGGEITVKRDGVDLFGTVTDTTLTSGSVGLYSWGNNGARFDDVNVTSLVAQSATEVTSGVGIDEDAISTSNSTNDLFLFPDPDGAIPLGQFTVSVDSEGSDSPETVTLESESEIADFSPATSPTEVALDIVSLRLVESSDDFFFS